MERPLVSFAVGCYNQEAFIREAIEGAFSQTYSPLEIVISDDCSRDRTFDVVQRLAAAYKGPHAIRLNRNARNLGLAGNSNRISALCRGELVVGAAGDDISVPERTSLTVQAWNDSGRKATAIFSRFSTIDGDGRRLDETPEPSLSEPEIRFVHEQGTIAGFLRRRRPHVAGCAYAASQKVFSIFGPLPETVTYEDTAYCFRSILVGGTFTFIDAPLVQYRRHGRNITFGLRQSRPQSGAAFEEVQDKRRCEMDRFVEVYKCFAADAERAWQQGLIPATEYPAVRKMILTELRRTELKRELLIRGWFRRCAVFFQLYRNAIRPRELLTQLPFLMPKTLHRGGVVMLNKVRR